ncbi:hypothetical protein M8J77_004729 [Diaphorina citri]|nr:hypothetical protein M8J77_004729 [Diaphorina citri]
MGTVIFSEEVDNTLANDVPDDNCSNSISTDETNELLQMIDKLQKKVNELEARSHHPHPDNNSQVTNSNVPTVQPSIVVNMPSLDHLLPTFGGLFTENPHTFVTKLEENLKNYQIPTQNWIYLIKPQFIGQAKLWFENGNFEDYVHFKNMFLKKYDDLQVKLKLKADFFGQMQNQGEPTEQFIQRKVKLHKRLHPDTDVNSSLAQIRELLHPKVRAYLTVLPTSVEEMIEQGKIIDQALGSTHMERMTPKEGTSTAPRFSVPRCKHCKTEFHYFKDCPKLKPQKDKGVKTVFDKGDNDLPRINITLEGNLLTALLDSGSFKNFIPKSLLSAEQLKRLYPSQYSKACLANGSSQMKIIGFVDISLEIGSMKFYSKFAVVDNLSEQVILGKPFLKNTASIIDFQTNCLILGKEGRETVYFIGYVPTTNDVFTVDDAEINTAFTSDLKARLKKLLEKYSTVFDNSKPLSQTKDITHKINMKNNKVINCMNYKVSAEKKQIISDQVKEMLDQNLIEPSTSPYNSPVVLVAKDDKEPRFCVDYRKINEWSHDEDTENLNIKELINDIGQNTIYSTIDLKRGYWQIKLEETSKPYTAFTTPDNRKFQWKVLPFGLKGSPGTFIRLMRKTLEGFLGKFCQVFLDDILVYSKTMEDHFHHLELVFERLKLHQLRASLKKCHFGKDELSYLGHTITPESNKVQEAHVLAIQNAPVPTSKKKLQSFLGLCNWLRDFVPKSSEVMNPLTAILHRKPFRWNETDTVHFNKIKETFQNLEPLHRPDYNLTFILQTDASDIGISATLYQEDAEGKRRIISNASSKLNPTEKRYHINEKECLAVVWAVKKYRGYLDGKKFILRTDSKAVTWLEKFKDSKSKLVRWALLLQEFSFEIQHVKGTENELPDAMSRQPLDTPVGKDAENWSRMLCPELSQDGSIHVNAVVEIDLLQQIKAEQREDSYCKNIVKHLEENKDYKSNKYKLDDLLYIRNGPDTDFKILLPKTLTNKVIELHHSDDLYCHPGRDQTLLAIKKQFAWPGMNKEVARYVKKCEVCARVKTAGRTTKTHLTPRAPTSPMHTVSVDLMGPYVRSKKGKNYLLVAMDTFSKWTEAYPVSNPDSKKILPLLEEFFARFGYPLVVITDNGPQFSSKIWKEQMTKWNIQHHTIAAYTARQNPVERQNQVIKNKLRVFLLENNHKTWDVNIQKILFSMRNSVNAGTKYSPAELMFGKNIRHPQDLKTLFNDSVEEDEYVDQKRQSLRLLEKKARDNMFKYKEKYASKETPKPLEPAQEVYLRNHQLSSAPNNVTASLLPRWHGPYIIQKHLGGGVYKCVHAQNTKDVRKVDQSQMQLYPNDV